MTGYMGSAYAIASVIGPRKRIPWKLRPSIQKLTFWRHSDWRGSNGQSELAMVVKYVPPVVISRTAKIRSFYINLPCGALAAAAFILFFKVPKGVKPPTVTLKEKLLQMDVPGFLLVTASVVCYLWVMQWGGVLKKWSSSDVIGTLVGSIVLFIAFLVWEWYQGERALLLPSIMRQRTIIHGCAFSFL